MKELREALNGIVSGCALMDAVLDVLADMFGDDVRHDAVAAYADMLSCGVRRIQDRVDDLRVSVDRLER